MNGKKIVLEIRSIDSPDVGNLWAWQPQSNEEVIFLIEMEIGEKNTVGADLFQVVIATPEALLLQSSKKFKIIQNRSTIIISKYEWRSIYNGLIEVVKHCESSTWIESVTLLQRFFIWEYEDYHG